MSHSPALFFLHIELPKVWRCFFFKKKIHKPGLNMLFHCVKPPKFISVPRITLKYFSSLCLLNMSVFYLDGAMFALSYLTYTMPATLSFHSLSRVCFF